MKQPEDRTYLTNVILSRKFKILVSISFVSKVALPPLSFSVLAFSSHQYIVTAMSTARILLSIDDWFGNPYLLRLASITGMKDNLEL